MTNQEIIDICTKYGIENYIINQDGSIDVNGVVDLTGRYLTEIPLKFNRVSSSFWCDSNQLTSLEGSPSYVGGSFLCHCNKLTSLEHSSKFIGGDFDCYWNPLESLDGLKVPYKKLYCTNKDNLVRKHKLKTIIKNI